MSQMLRLGFRHKLVDGDALAQLVWLPKRRGYGRARYATAVMLIDPDRLSNPQQQFDQRYMRGGVKIDEIGAAVGYYIRQAHHLARHIGAARRQKEAQRAFDLRLGSRRHIDQLHRNAALDLLGQRFHKTFQSALYRGLLGNRAGFGRAAQHQHAAAALQ